MFGYVTASIRELTPEQKRRYGAVYCGICRSLGRYSQTARLALSYDMVFLALLQLSLYEPAADDHAGHCPVHPFREKPWLESSAVDYAADMNLVLAYYNCLDDWEDDRRLSARLLCRALEEDALTIAQRYPRQCGAIRQCLQELSALEREKCENPDAPAACFGRLMSQLLIWQEDLWMPVLADMGFHLGRFIYLADAVADREKDLRSGSYNPLNKLHAAPEELKKYLVLAMSRCTESFEKLPLVQDKDILDNILYSGVWTQIANRFPKGGSI